MMDWAGRLVWVEMTGSLLKHLRHPGKGEEGAFLGNIFGSMPALGCAEIFLPH